MFSLKGSVENAGRDCGTTRG